MCVISNLFITFAADKAAQMVESVDTRDLKSLGQCGRTGSSAVAGTVDNTYELSGNKLVVKSGTNWYTENVHSYKKK